MLTPTADNVVIRRDESADVTDGGIHLATPEKPKNSGTVIAIGPEVDDLADGDHVFFKSHPLELSEVDVDDETLLVMPERDVVLRVDPLRRR